MMSLDHSIAEAFPYPLRTLIEVVERQIDYALILPVGYGLKRMVPDSFISFYMQRNPPLQRRISDVLSQCTGEIGNTL